MSALRLILVVVLTFCAVGIIWADDPVITDVQVVRPLEDGITVNTQTQSGMKATTILNGAPIMFMREVATTLAWTPESTNDETNEYLDMLAPQAGPFGNKTCCKFVCDSGYNFYFDFYAHDCSLGGSGCQVCIETCSGGWYNCPVGTKMVAGN